MRKTLLKVLTTGLLMTFIGLKTAHTQARVQVIHNSADALASQVDVYLGTTKILEDFSFRTATPYLDVPAGTPITIGIAPSTSSTVAEVFGSFTYTLTSGSTYVLVADGIESTSGYTPAPAFDLKVYAMGREQASTAGQTDVLIHHGSTDAPVVDVVETGAGAGTIVDNAAYGDFAGYLELPTANYVVEVRDASGTVTVASYDVPLSDYGLQDSALVVVASGFLNPASNSNGPAFGLWVALPSGGELIELPTSTARVQVIHNSADAAADEVDVYLGSTKIADNFAFRTATPFIDLPAGVDIEISVAPDTSTSVASAIATFDLTLQSGSTYIVVADGIVSSTGYSPAPAFDLKIYNMGREEASSPGETDVLVHHGSTDAPVVDVVETGVGAGTIVDNAAYGDFAGYLELPTSDYVLEIRDQTGATTVATFLAPLSSAGLQDSAIVVVASGFLNPAANSNGPAFGLWVAFASGGPLFQLSNTTSADQISANPTNLSVYPNPASDVLTLTQNGEEIQTINVFDSKGVLINSFNPNATTFTINVQALESGLYHIQTLSESGLKNTKVQVNK